jgi:hypothetical protein
MDYLGAPHLDVPMAEMTEVVMPAGHGGPKSITSNLGPPAEASVARRSVTGYDATFESKTCFPFI